VKDTAITRSLIVFSSVACAASAGALVTLIRYVRHEIRRRNYPSWEECQCDFKTQKTIFQVWHSRHEQRGETIVSEEWGIYLVKPGRWLRRFLHHSSQVIATLNPRNRYVERVTLSPQEAYLFAAILHARASNEDVDENFVGLQSYIVWRREVLHFPRHFFDACVRRIYPAHVSPERLAHAEHLPVLWDPTSSLPLPTESNLLDTPIGTRIDYIGWSPSQIAYCTARLANQA
jgi:hypothetical protein